METSKSLPLEKLMQHVEILYYDRVLLFEGTTRQVSLMLTYLCVHPRD